MKFATYGIVFLVFVSFHISIIRPGKAKDSDYYLNLIKNLSKMNEVLRGKNSNFSC